MKNNSGKLVEGLQLKVRGERYSCKGWKRYISEVKKEERKEFDIKQKIGNEEKGNMSGWQFCMIRDKVIARESC